MELGTSESSSFQNEEENEIQSTGGELPSHKEHLACSKRSEKVARLVQTLVCERELRGSPHL